MSTINIEGIIPAVIVPMREDFSIDFQAFRHYLEWVVSHKVVGLAVNVDTGEGPYLTPDERFEVIRISKQVANGKCAIIAGVGGPSTITARMNAIAAMDAGADALLVFPTPAFINDPLDERIMLSYHQAISDASGLPIILFQLGTVFGGVNYPPEVLAKTLDLPEVIGIKDASFDPVRFTTVRDLVNNANHPLTLLTGNDNFLLESFVLGAQGGLLGYGAVGVQLLIEMLDAVKTHEFDRAAAMQKRVQGFCDYIYAKPYGDYRARCKVALVHMGILTPDQTYVRPPFLSLWDEEKEKALNAVTAAGLMNVVNDLKYLG